MSAPMSIDKLIEELRGSLEGVTEGPWTLGTGSKGELCLVRQYSAYDYEFISGEFAKDEDAEFLANCDPNNIRTLLDALASSQEEIERLRKALEPFAAMSQRFDAAAREFGVEPRPDSYVPRTDFTHGELRAAARALPEQTDEMHPDKYTGGDFNGVVRGKRP